MQFTIDNISHRSHDLNDEIVYFYFDVHFTSPTVVSAKNQFYPYNELTRYLKKQHPDFYKYLESVRISIEGWGPKEATLLNEVGGEAVEQLYGYLNEYITTSDWSKGLYEHALALQNMPLKEQVQRQQQAATIVNELGELGKKASRESMRCFLFCETVEKQIRQTAAEVYPEIFEADAAHLKEFKHLFVRDIQSMQGRIDNLLEKIKKGNHPI